MPKPSDKKSGLTYKRLRQVVVYNDKTERFTWLINGKGRFQRRGDEAGSRDQRKYRVITIDGRTYYYHRLVWFYKRKKWPAREIDHADGDTGSLRNLRPASRRQNAMNRGPTCCNKFGMKGVSATRNGKRFCAFYGVRGVTYYIGTFDTPEQAARAYDAAVTKAFGKFAWLNFPQASG